jgi:CBS domain-containing protein
MTCAPRRIRTFDLPLRRRSLYPLSYRGRCRGKLSRSPAGPAIVRPGIVGWGAIGAAEECGTVQVRDVMTEATITETPTDKLRTAAERMWREQTGSLLITTDGRLTGIITERDVLRAVALGADPDLATVDEAMTIDVYTVPPDMPLHVAAREMAARWIRHLPVVENGQLLGVISMRDVTGVFGALGAGDSEIDIEHEFDQLVRKRRLARIERGNQA